ncbi:glycosyltransferase family 4 protein [uncultured Apibacter sp.]|uniref:glycosyltransferase family 4 protein n=1 Tax=uncultured Apibacter sp. TaxID=1778616 RepID=UPI0025FA601F|nr:glycosyltransferase family 4 protein [uncultured Apibacter sp.]
MKIAYCIGNIHNSGGIERVISLKSNYLVNKGYEVHIVVIYPSSEKPFFHFDSRIKFHYLNLDFEKENGIIKHINFNKNKKIFLQTIAKLFEEIKPDIAISTFCKYSKYIYELKDGSKKIIERHFAKYKRAQYYSKLDKYYLGRIITYLYRKKDYDIVKHFDRFVVLTHEDKKSWGEYLTNLEVIENPLTLIPENYASLTNKKVISLGRLNQQKQFDHLIDIWKIIAQKYPDWKLVIYGNGEKEKELKKKIKSLNLDSSIKIYPAISDISSVLLESSIYVMTSKYEGFPLTLIETMSHGVPPISYNCKSGPKEIICDGIDGLLVPFNNKEIFVEKISYLIENDKIRKLLGRAASQNVLRYSPDTIMEKWINLFQSLVCT